MRGVGSSKPDFSESLELDVIATSSVQEASIVGLIAINSMLRI